MHINIKDDLPLHIALAAVLSAMNHAEQDEKGNTVYPKLTAVPIHQMVIMVKTEPNRKSECFKVWIKRD